MNHWTDLFPPRTRLKHRAVRGDKSIILDDADRNNVRLMRRLLGGMPTYIEALPEEPANA